MRNSKISSFLILLLVCCPIFAESGPRSKISLVAGTHQIIATIYLHGKGFYQYEVLSFRSAAEGRLLKAMKSVGFEKPIPFYYGGENFVHVSTIPEGSGGFTTDTIFWIAPDDTMHEIDMENAPEAYEDKVNEHEMVLVGGSGVNCSGGKLNFQFYIANDTDPYCCPTAGKVTGNYQIIGESKFDPNTKQYSSNFKMVVTQYLRTPIASHEMFAHFVR
jgi:hypothetical protein